MRTRTRHHGARALGVLIIALALGTGCSDGSDHAAPPEPFDEFGGTPPSAEELAGYPKALPASGYANPAAATASVAAAPSAFVIPESTLPPVQAQGTPTMLGYPGSCEVWSAGYAMGSYAANLANQNDIKDLANTVSTAYVYRTVLAGEQKSCGEGTAPADTLNLLASGNVPSLAAIPYYPVCECPPGSDQCLDAVDIDESCANDPALCTDLSIGSWNGFAKEPIEDTLGLIKTWIAERHVVQISIVVPYEFGTYTSGVYVAPTSCPTGAKCALFHGIACGASTKTPSGCAQHGIAIVGYDDALGALRIQNSFGTGWGESGYMWLSYDTFAAIYLGGTIAFAPPSSSPATAAAAPSAADAGHQWVDERDGATPRVHLVFASTLAEPLRLHDIAITTPEGRTLTHDYGGHAFVRGHHYVTRHDGKQFTAGTYGVRLAGETRDGRAQVVAASVEVALAPGSDLPAAPPGDDVTGTNGLPVR